MEKEPQEVKQVEVVFGSEVADGCLCFFGCFLFSFVLIGEGVSCFVWFSLVNVFLVCCHW